MYASRCIVFLAANAYKKYECTTTAENAQRDIAFSGRIKREGNSEGERRNERDTERRRIAFTRAWRWALANY